MKLREFVESLRGRMRVDIDNISLEHSEVLRKTSSTIGIIERYVLELKQFVVVYKFIDINEEVDFFKEIKPEFVSQLLYHKKLLRIQIFDCYNRQDAKSTFFDKHLKICMAFIKKQTEFYQYFLSGATHFDAEYFTRSSSILLDDRFASKYDMKLSKILSCEAIKNYLMGLRNNDCQNPHGNSLRWTGSKTDLIELVYALHASKVLNDSSLDLKDIATQFESFFNVSLGNYYRVFQDIRLRKINQTKFLDSVKQALLKRIENFDS